ncbi:uncharacterized protein LOC105683086 [Athalia rosae]|uniref:uncharacterized protein LOC105683086 n=1 Tax=Athalia rosae TaxID=37344 RepID=UPI00203478A2|nr:uncharacterized protein LOC105683086 [Athalia rosae]XP_012250851.2 uncharacterized protein LOC105683086 [Athalia rosae]XP_048507255.1 uncharacterized protein LOC105683086 [Athalia rosae]
MDFEIVKCILQNGGADISNIDLENCASEIRDDKLESRNPALISALAKSFTTSLQYRVSPAAHQRYLVRTNLIEQLRDWSRITSRYAGLHTFTDGEKTAEFTMHLVKRYLTEEFLVKQTTVNVLIKLGFALIDIKLKYPTFDYKLDKIINKILQLSKTPDSNKFLDIIIDKYKDLSLEWVSIENIYIHKAEELIEIPIVNLFIIFHENRVTEKPDLKSIQSYIDPSAENCLHPTEKLLQYSSKSPRIFQLLSSVLREILSYTNCSMIVLDYIQFILEHISTLCQQQNKHILDLYPRKLQYIIILLRIEPELHTDRTRDYLLQTVTSTYHSNRTEIAILLSHFPKWIKKITDHISLSNDPFFR